MAKADSRICIGEIEMLKGFVEEKKAHDAWKAKRAAADAQYKAEEAARQAKLEEEDAAAAAMHDNARGRAGLR